MSDRAPNITVAELIRALSRLPADLPVLVDGYEGGLDFPFRPVVVPVGVDWDEGSQYFGRYGEDAPGDNFLAVVLGRSGYYVERFGPQNLLPPVGESGMIGADDTPSAGGTSAPAGAKQESRTIAEVGP